MHSSSPFPYFLTDGTLSFGWLYALPLGLRLEFCIFCAVFRNFLIALNFGINCVCELGLFFGRLLFCSFFRKMNGCVVLKYAWECQVCVLIFIYGRNVRFLHGSLRSASCGPLTYLLYWIWHLLLSTFCVVRNCPAIIYLLFILNFMKLALF